MEKTKQEKSEIFKKAFIEAFGKDKVQEIDGFYVIALAKPSAVYHMEGSPAVLIGVNEIFKHDQINDMFKKNEE